MMRDARFKRIWSGRKVLLISTKKPPSRKNVISRALLWALLRTYELGKIRLFDGVWSNHLKPWFKPSTSQSSSLRCLCRGAAPPSSRSQCPRRRLSAARPSSVRSSDPKSDKWHPVNGTAYSRRSLARRRAGQGSAHRRQHRQAAGAAAPSHPRRGCRSC